MSQKEFPAYMYHKEDGAKIFNSEEELKKAGTGWQDTPFKEEKKEEKKETKSKGK